VAAASLFIEFCWGVEEAEACAIRAGLQLAMNHTLKPTSLKSDRAVVGTTANKSSVNVSRCWNCCKDISKLPKAVPGNTN
jgi:hypothetical protein